MLLTLQVTSVLLVSVAMALALAHALELPGKLRLDRPTYLAVQTIYYPGFTYGGLGEGLGMVGTVTLLVLLPARSTSWWWTLIAVVALVAMHAVYWVFTHPVNKFWLKDQELKGFGRGFFAIGGSARDSGSEREDLWERARDRWEYSHVVRAVLAMSALAALVVSVAI
jgi:Domain of unknown function (DUF1772)